MVPVVLSAVLFGLVAGGALKLGRAALGQRSLARRKLLERHRPSSIDGIGCAQCSRMFAVTARAYDGVSVSASSSAGKASAASACGSASPRCSHGKAKRLGSSRASSHISSLSLGTRRSATSSPP